MYEKVDGCELMGAQLGARSNSTRISTTRSVLDLCLPLLLSLSCSVLRFAVMSHIVSPLDKPSTYRDSQSSVRPSCCPCSSFASSSSN